MATYRSHASALHTGHLHVFDPNWGEWRIGSAPDTIRSWFRALEMLYSALDSGMLFNTATLGHVRLSAAGLVNLAN
jgi:hypothetical protein